MKLTKAMMMGMASVAVLGTAACTDAAKAKAGGYGDEHKVELYSGGKLVREWVSSGKVQSEETSDGYFFMDKETKKLVEVSGNVVISKN